MPHKNLVSDNYNDFIERQNKSIASIQYKIYQTFNENRLPILIYQMGKVGSKSYYSALENNAKVTPFHVHRMLPISNLGMINHYINNGKIDLALTERQWMEIYDKIILETRV